MKDEILALGRMKDRAMNKTEAAYAERLERLKQAGEIVWYEFESMKFRLAEKTFYTPDFMVLRADGLMEVHEVKGYWMEDARVKIKLAAEKFPFRFLAIRVRTKKQGGGWEVEDFSFGRSGAVR